MYENNNPAQPVSVGRYTAKTFAWMFLGLAATFAVMVATYFSGLVTMFLSLPAMAIMAAVGYFTAVDLSRLRPLLIGGLILMIVFNLLGMFFGFGGAERLLCFAGVALFLAFTAYDVQKIKAMYAAYSYNPAILSNASILAALQLYLDFVNLFLYILRLFGNRD